MDSNPRAQMNINLEQLRNASFTVRMTTIFAVISAAWWGSMTLHAEYTEWHDNRYARRAEILSIAQADKIKGDLEATKTLAEKNSSKLDVLNQQQRQLSQDFSTYAASSLVSQARSDLRSHMAARETAVNYEKWAADKEALEARLRKAEEFRACVIAEEMNCNRFLLTPN